MTNATLRGKPDAGNPHVRFDEGEVASAKPRRGSLLYKTLVTTSAVVASLLSAFGGTTWYVSPSGDDTNDGKSWATAFATPYQAVNVAYQKGDMVILSNGTYQIATTLNPGNYTKPWLHLRSFTLDPKDVVLDGGGTTQILRCGVDAGQKCVIEGLTFRNARTTGTDEGGAIRFAAGTYTDSSVVSANVISNCVFQNCHNDSYVGGAVLVGNGDTVVDCTFSNCTAMTKGNSAAAIGLDGTVGGGAIYAGCFCADVAITRCQFTECGASNGVGVVAVGCVKGIKSSPNCTNGFRAVVTDCAFSNNWSYGLQAICCNFKARRVTGCSFAGNFSVGTVSGKGAGVFGTCLSRELNLPGETNVYAGCTFEGNSSAVWPTIVRYDGDVPFVFTNCVFRRNSSGGSSASLIRTKGYTEFSDCTIKANETTHLKDPGGDLYEAFPLINLCSTSKPAVFRRTVVDGNVACGGAGLVVANSPGSEVTDCTFRRNLVCRNGQGIPALLTLQGPANDVLVRGCLFACNTNDNTITPAQVYIGPTVATAGRYCGGTNAVVENCTFVGNRCRVTNWNTAAAGVFHVGDSGGTARIVNSVFSDNRSTASSSFRNFTDASDKGVRSQYAARFCWEDGTQVPVAPTYTDYHNIRGSDPRFVDAANGDYCPRSGSPLRGKGLVKGWMEDAVDLAGNPRLQYGKVDIGCYERPSTGLLILFQ